MSSWAAWAALGLVLILWAVVVVAVVLVLRFWRQVAPTVGPMLAMFAPPASSSTVELVPDTDPINAENERGPS